MADNDLASRVRHAIETYGARRAARALGLSVEATCRLAGRLPTQPGTVALAQANLHQLAALDDRAA